MSDALHDRSLSLCCKPADPYCTRLAGHWGPCSYIVVWYRGRHVESCEQCGGPFDGAAVTGGELLLCTSCERDEAFALWAKALVAQDKEARTQYTRQRLNARKREGDGPSKTR